MKYALTIIVSDETADEDSNVISSAISNLEYDGFTIHDYTLTEAE